MYRGAPPRIQIWGPLHSVSPCLNEWLCERCPAAGLNTRWMQVLVDSNDLVPKQRDRGSTIQCPIFSTFYSISDTLLAYKHRICCYLGSYEIGLIKSKKYSEFC